MKYGEEEKLEPKSLQEELNEANNEHLETKKEIENLRDQYGDQWLHQEGGNLVSSIIGYEIPKREISSEQILQKFLQSSFDSSPTLGTSKPDQQTLTIPKTDENNINIITSTPIERSNMIGPSATDLQSSPTKSSKSEYKSADDTNDQINSFYKSTIENTIKSIDDIYNTSAFEQTISDPEENEINYDVALDSGEQLFLVVSDVSIREKDINTGRTKNKWTLKMLESCERVKSDVIQINFDTVRKDKKQRNYKMDKVQCQKLENYLRNILSERPLSEMKQTLYRCANCSVHFSREITKHNLGKHYIIIINRTKIGYHKNYFSK